MTKENGKYTEGIIDGYLAVKPAGTIAAFLPWPKKWISCDLLDGLLRIYNKSEDEHCTSVAHLPGSEYAVDTKEPLQFSITVKHPTTDQYNFRAENNEDYTMWIDTVRACGATSRTARRTLSSTTSYSSRSSLISRCSSTDTDHGFANGDEIEGITRRLQSLEESVYCSDERMSESSESEKTKKTLESIQTEVGSLKSSLDHCVQNLVMERKEHKYKERLLEGEKIELMENVSTLKSQNDKLAVELTSEQNLRYKHSLELAQQMCINARQWEMRYLRLSLGYLKLQTFLQHIDSGFLQQNTISTYLENDHMDNVKSIAEYTECTEPTIETNNKSHCFVDSLGFRTQFETHDLMLRYMCQQRLPDHITHKLESTETLANRWSKLLDKTGDCIKRNRESRELCRLGVPASLRTRIWDAFINYRCAKLIKSKGPRYYQSLVQSPEISPSEKQISLDLHRSFPRNVYFNSDDGTKVPVLHRILVAFSLHNRAIGYCQGMNMIAGMLIFHLDEEMAFWGLVAILEMIMPAGYYNTDLLAARADQIIFQELVENKLPCLAAYLRHHDIDLSLFSFNWFMTIFIDSLPMDAVIRLWDLFLLEGHKTILRFSLSLVKLHEYSLMQHQDSVSIFNMFRTTSRCFYDCELVIKLAYSEFHPFPKRGELYKRHSEKLTELRAEHAENERQWRERQQLQDTVDSDTWDIVPQQTVSPEPPSSCILHTVVHDTVMWAVHSEKLSGVTLLKIDLENATIVQQSEVMDYKVMCCTYSAGYVLLGTSNGYVLSYNCNRLCKLWTTWIMDCVLGIIVYNKQILAHLSNGSLVKFEGISETGLYCPSILDIGTCPIKTGVVVRGVSRDMSHVPVATNYNLNNAPPRHINNTAESGGSGSGTSDELWCSSGNTVHFVDLRSWRVQDKLCVSSHSSTQIHRIVAYSSSVIFISVHSTISIWDVREKVCLSQHDCSSIFLPPPSPRSAKYAGTRMSIHSLYHHPRSRTLWVGTTHGHLLIYEVAQFVSAERRADKGEGLSVEEARLRDVSDEEASIAVLSRGDHTHNSVSPRQNNNQPMSLSRLFSSSSPRTRDLSRDLNKTPLSEEENSISVLSEEPGMSASTNIMLETSLVMIPSRDFKLSDEQSVELQDPLQRYDPVRTGIPPRPLSPNAKEGSACGGVVSGRRRRTATMNEYDVMEDHCDIIESAADNDLSPVHVYQAFGTYHSQENLEDLEREGEFELIVEEPPLKQGTILTLNTYQILSGDPIAHISSLTLDTGSGSTDTGSGSTDTGSGSTEQIMTCAGSVSQEGVVVLWKRLQDEGKVRWQAQPVTMGSVEEATAT